MAKLTYVYRSDEMNCVKVSKRQLPLIGGENLMMLMDLNTKGLIFDHSPVIGLELEEFTKKYRLLSPAELRLSLNVPTIEFTAMLSQNVPCVGCRRSVERLFYQLMLSGHPTLDPIVITNKGILTISDDKMKSPQSVCTLFHKHRALLEGLVDNQFRNRKSSRCSLHSLDSFRLRPFSETWRDVWNCMKQQCKDEIAVIEASELHTTLNSYLKKHKFCQECRTKVEKAYSLLVEESNPAKEKGYVAHLYSGIKRCLTDKHIHLQTKFEYIDGLITRAEPELSGRNSKHRERHAKTLEIAQEEVLTCIGMCLYERLRRINVCLREEENACQVLAAVAVHALCRSFDMAVENKQGISNLELLYQEISREERSREQKKEQKKLKKRKKRNEKKRSENGLTIFEKCEKSKCLCSTDDFENTGFGTVDRLVECDNRIINANVGRHENPPRYETTCNSCEEAVHSRQTTAVFTLPSIDGGYSSEPQNTESSNVSDSITSSLVSTPEGSEIACSEGFCNHDSVLHSRESTTTYNGKGIRRTMPQKMKTSPKFTMTLQEMLDKSSVDDDDGEIHSIPQECIMEFKLRSNVIKQQREALRQQLLSNFKRLCISHCMKENQKN
ncbi:gametogenetin-binding protein 2-like [Toxorhynchites rutilus septentrionalis]|uniref:gametogenetin-binding protein 2-like n=1 Tax=Toxorhynchites rutilus septentrionalis TaxID=329112 RepID=UPI002478AB8A|nr:gametogenetin-binding protein 2-like [Toxorhynchites rutilus septentrionalis]